MLITIPDEALVSKLAAIDHAAHEMQQLYMTARLQNQQGREFLAPWFRSAQLEVLHWMQTDPGLQTYWKEEKLRAYNALMDKLHVPRDSKTSMLKNLSNEELKALF